MSTNTSDLLFEAVKSAFNNWTAYQLALTHNFAGSKTKDIAEWFLEATHQYIKENDDLEDYELEEFFEDTMNTEFNSILEDESAIQLARLLLNYNKMIKQNRENEVKEDLLKRFPSNKSVNSSIKYKDANLAEDDSSSSENEEDEDDDNEMESDTNNNKINDENTKNKNKLSEKEEQDYQMVEEGWTFVAKSGKHFTK